MAVPLTANLAVEGITNRPNPESRNARKQQPTPGFLAKSNTCSGQITAIVQSLPNSSRATKVFDNLSGTLGRPTPRWRVSCCSYNSLQYMASPATRRGGSRIALNVAKLSELLRC
jgi:hypothetical protein